MNKKIINALKLNIEVYTQLCNRSGELKKMLHNRPADEEYDFINSQLRLVRKLLDCYQPVIVATKQYIKFMAQHDPTNMKPKSDSTTDPRIVGCVHRFENAETGESLCGQHIDGDNCLGEECPYITDPEEFETVTIAKVGKVLNDVLTKHGVELSERKSIIKDLNKALEQ